MSKKIGTRGLVVVLACLLVVLPMMACAKKEPAKVWDLKLSAVWTPGAILLEPVYHFADLVAERTDGRVHVTVYPAQQLVKMPQELTACGEGVTDISVLITPYFAGNLRLTDGLNTPFAVPPSADEAIKMLREVQPLLEPEYTANNVKLLTGGTFELCVYCRESHVKALEDFTGRKFTCMPGKMTTWLKECGGAVANVPGPELYMALQRGICDGSWVNASLNLTERYYEVAPYVTDAEMSGGYMCYVMNLDVWNSLPTDLQDIITECGREQEEWLYDMLTENMTVRGLRDEFKEVGSDVYFVPKEERQRWIDKTKPVWEKYVEERGPDGQKLYDAVLKYQSK